MIIPYTHSTTLFVKLGEAMLKCSSSDVPWKMLNFTNPMISALLSGNTMKCESGLLRAYAALYLQTSLLMPWRSVTSIPSIVLEEVCSQENHKSEHNALVAFLLSLLLSFDTILQQAAFRDVDSTLFVIPALRLRIFLPSSVLATLNFAKLSNSAGVSILEMVLADTLNRITETDRLSRTLGFLERLLQEQGGICKVTEMEKDSIVSFIKVVKSDHRGDDKVSSLCNEILGHSD